MSNASQFTKPTTNAAIPGAPPRRGRDREDQPKTTVSRLRQVVIAPTSRIGRSACSRPHSDAPLGSWVPIDREDVERARDVIAGRLHRTPTLSCRRSPDAFLGASCSEDGLAKARGVHRRSLSDEENAPGSSRSRRNHAQAVAWGAAREGPDALSSCGRASEAKVAARRGHEPPSTWRRGPRGASSGSRCCSRRPAYPRAVRRPFHRRQDGRARDPRGLSDVERSSSMLRLGASASAAK